MNLSEDLYIAKNHLVNNKMKIAIVSNSCVLHSSDQNGILFLKKLYFEGLDFSSASIADKVVGSAAAWIIILLQIKNIYADLISKRALFILSDNCNNLEFKNKTDFIFNKEKNDICPMEKKFISVNTLEDAITELNKLRS
jgi:hypothetical protein